jgi:hypothetical protein
MMHELAHFKPNSMECFRHPGHLGRQLWLTEFSAKTGKEVSLHKLHVVERIILKSMLRKYRVE